MRKFILPLLLVSTFLLAGCNQSPAPSSTSSDTPAADQKVGTTTKTGTVTQVGERYFIQESGKQPEEIESLSVDLSQYVGQTITVSGQFSGDTLFVGEVQ